LLKNEKRKSTKNNIQISPDELAEICQFIGADYL